MHRGSKGAEGARSTLPDKWLASPCCVPPHRKGHTGRNVNGHLIATQERIVIRGSTASPTTWQNHRWWDRDGVDDEFVSEKEWIEKGKFEKEREIIEGKDDAMEEKWRGGYTKKFSKDLKEEIYPFSRVNISRCAPAFKTYPSLSPYIYFLPPLIPCKRMKLQFVHRQWGSFYGPCSTAKMTTKKDE